MSNYYKRVKIPQPKELEAEFKRGKPQYETLAKIREQKKRQAKKPTSRLGNIISRLYN